jgi:hypothetical protein
VRHEGVDQRGTDHHRSHDVVEHGKGPGIGQMGDLRGASLGSKRQTVSECDGAEHGDAERAAQ